MKTIAIITFGRSDLQFFKQDIQYPFKFIQNDNNNNNNIKTLLAYNDISIELVKNRDRDDDSFLLSKPRIDGEKILQHYETFSNIIKFPLITPFLNQLNKSIDYFILVYTNQSDPKYLYGDTLYYASVFKKYSIYHWNYKEDNFVDFPITENVADIDFQYSFFEKKM